MSKAETQHKLQPALWRLSAMISQYFIWRDAVPQFSKPGIPERHCSSRAYGPTAYRESKSMNAVCDNRLPDSSSYSPSPVHRMFSKPQELSTLWHLAHCNQRSANLVVVVSL